MTTEQRIATLLELGCTPQQIKLELAGVAGLPQAELGGLICRLAARRGGDAAHGPVPEEDAPRPPIAIHRGRREQEERIVPLPQEFADRWLARLERAELRCYIYICRRTRGFGKHEDAISIEQFMHGIRTRDGRRLDEGTGLTRNAVRSALARLEALGLIIRTRRDSDRHGHEATLYALAPLPPADLEDAGDAEHADGGQPLRVQAGG